MKVGDVLRTKKGTRIATVLMHETVAIADRLLREESVGVLVVNDVCHTEGNVAVGMFTEHDVARAVAKHGALGLGLKVASLISVQQFVSCSSTDTLEHVLDLMHRHHIGYLPVIDDQNLVGVISMREIELAREGGDSAAWPQAFHPDSVVHAQAS